MATEKLTDEASRAADEQEKLAEKLDQAEASILEGDTQAMGAKNRKERP